MKFETKLEYFTKALNKHKEITSKAHGDFNGGKLDTFSRISLHFIYERIDSTVILLRYKNCGIVKYCLDQFLKLP